MYPNPASSNVNILTDVTTELETLSVNIYNVLGVSVYQTTIESMGRLNDLDVSMLASGVYTVQVKMITKGKEEIKSVHKADQEIDLMKKLVKLLLLFIGVAVYGQNSLSIVDGEYGLDTDFSLDVNLETDTAIKALQLDIKFDEQNFDYKSSYNLNKDRLGGSESDHVMTIKKISTSDSQTDKLRILIYSPTNKIIPTGDGKLFSADFKTRKKQLGKSYF